MLARAANDESPSAPAHEPPPSPTASAGAPELSRAERQAEALKLYARGRNEALDNRHLQAIIDFQKALELDPESSEIVRELARSYATIGNNSKAVDLYLRLAELDPENLEALFTLGLAAANRRDFHQAAAALGRLKLLSGSQIASVSADPAAMILVDFSLATALRELGYDRALIEAAASAVEFPASLATSGPNLARLGSVYRQRGETWRMIGDARCRLSEHRAALDAYAQSAGLPLADPAALTPRVIYANLCLGRTASAQLALLDSLEGNGNAPPSIDVAAPPTGVQAPPPPSASSVSFDPGDREVQLCAYLAEHAQPVKLLAEAVMALHRARPDHSGYVRAAASLLPPEGAQQTLKAFVDRRPRDLQAVTQLLTWLAARDQVEAVRLAASLAAEHPDLTDDYSARLTVAISDPALARASLRSLPESPARSALETWLLARVGGLGEAWTICRQARARWPNDRGLILRELRLAAALREPALLEGAMKIAAVLDDAPGLIARSQARRVSGQTEDALRLAEQAHARDPNGLEALTEVARAGLAHATSLASASRSLDEGARALVERAVAAADEAASMDPRREEPYEVLLLIYGPGGVLADTNLYRETFERLVRSNPHSPLAARLEAERNLTAKRYEQAVERLINLYAADPLQNEALTQAVTAWGQWGRLDAAERWLAERLRERPGDPSLREQAVRVQLLQKRPDRVIEQLEGEVASNPDDLIARRLLEEVLRAANQFDAALELGEQRLLTRPPGVRRELELAVMYANAERAERVFERLEWIREHAGEAGLDDLQSALTVAQSAGGAADDARRDALLLDLVQETIERFPAAPLQVYEAGLRTMARMGRLDAGFDALASRAAEASAPVSAATANSSGRRGDAQTNAVQWHGLAQRLANDGLEVAAGRAVRVAIDSAANDAADVAAFLGRIALVLDAAAAAAASKTGDDDAARAHAEESARLLMRLNEHGLLAGALRLRAEPTIAEALYEASIFYTLLGADAGSERLLREAIARDPKAAMAMNNLGYLRIEAGHADAETIEWIEAAHRLLPAEPNILDTIGWLRYRQGRFADAPEIEPAGAAGADPGAAADRGALSFIKDAIARDQAPSAEVFDHLGDTQWRLGDRDAAIEAWRQAERMLDHPALRQQVMQRIEQMQQEEWNLKVGDASAIYDREYGRTLESIKLKLEAAAQNQEPRIAPTFAELHP